MRITRSGKRRRLGAFPSPHDSTPKGSCSGWRSPTVAAGSPRKWRPGSSSHSSSTKPVGHGTGLGLPICRGIIEAHGGVLEVEGRPGVGALFRVWLPQGAEPRDTQRDTAHTPRAGHGEAVLVVDDEPEVTNLLVEMLSGAGYRVDTAADGRVAVEKISKKAYDVVLSDVKMPGLDGPGLYREIQVCRP